MPLTETQDHDRGRDRDEVRITVRVDREFLNDYEADVVDDGMYNNRSEAIRAAMRAHRSDLEH